MTDRDRNVMFNASGTVGGAITHTDDAELIASIEYYIEGNASEWTELVVPFTYKTNSTPEKLNIIIGAEDYFADRSKIGGYNQLTVDDVELVYWHALSTLSYEGATIDFNENTTSYDLSSVFYDEAKLAYTVKGQAATATKSYNEETGLLTIRVEGEDIAVKADSFTEYKIQFKPIIPGDVNGDGDVSITDVGLAIDHILGGNPSGFIFKAGDLNNDGEVSITDVGLMIDIILRED